MKKTMWNAKDIRELLVYAHKTHAQKSAFNIRTKESYYSVSYTDFIDEVFAAASVLAGQNVAGKHIALVGENSYEWVVASLAIISAGAVVVPIDKELTVDEIVGIAQSGDATQLFYSSSYTKAASLTKERLGLKINVIDKESDKICDGSLKTMVSEGKSAKSGQYKELFDVEINPDERCCIVYTSGTTGVSKGVMLSHTNLLSNIISGYKMLQFDSNRFSLLPMHHTYEFNVGIIYSIALGVVQSINNSIKYIPQNLKMFAPTDLVLVPLIVETLYGSIWTNIRKSGKEKLVKRMISLSNMLRKVGIDLRRVFFKTIHEALGGSVKRIFCGGALLDVAVAQGFEDFGIDINIGYGITECSPLIAGNCTHVRSKMGSCGFAAPDVEVDLFDKNEEGEGEVIARGKNVMLGYYKNPEATAAVVRDGWFHTGDIAKVDSDGYMWITGRIKNIIVLRNGKNIYPEEIEGYFLQIPYVKEVVVYGKDSGVGEETSLSAEIFPNFDRLEEDKITDYKTVILEQIEKINSTLAYYKRVSNITFREEEFAKTTSKKIKRDFKNGK